MKSVGKTIGTFFYYDWITLQSVIQSFLKTPVCGASLSHFLLLLFKNFRFICYLFCIQQKYASVSSSSGEKGNLSFKKILCKLPFFFLSNFFILFLVQFPSCISAQLYILRKTNRYLNYLYLSLKKDYVHPCIQNESFNAFKIILIQCYIVQIVIIIKKHLIYFVVDARLRR